MYFHSEEERQQYLARKRKNQKAYRDRKRQDGSTAEFRSELQWDDPREVSDNEVLDIWRYQPGGAEILRCMPNALANLIQAARYFAKQDGLTFNRFVAVYGRHEAIRARDAEQRGEQYTPSESILKLLENRDAN